MKKEIKHLSLRTSPELLKKFDYVAKYDDRSMNWLMIRLVSNYIAKFEAKHGKIEFDEEEEVKS
ncbi:MAG: ribbon-helix-helix domain-containing protein [Oscillospiraceae bacterium]|nr:ribbon-helix-helix domain-containing protein [Oscillospiraceae bacterium]